MSISGVRPSTVDSIESPHRLPRVTDVDVVVSIERLSWQLLGVNARLSSSTLATRSNVLDMTLSQVDPFSSLSTDSVGPFLMTSPRYERLEASDSFHEFSCAIA